MMGSELRYEVTATDKPSDTGSSCRILRRTIRQHSSIALSFLLSMGVGLGTATAQAPRAYVTNGGCISSKSETVSVIDTATNTVIATIPVGKSPLGVAITPNGALAYVTNASSDTVSVIDTATNTVVATILDLSGAGAVAITPDGTRAYVADNNSTVSVIETATNTVVATIAGLSGAGVAITPDGSHAYVTNFGPSTVSVIDTATNIVVTTVPVGVNPIGVAITPDGTRAYVTNNNDNTVSVIDTATNIVVATILVGTYSNAVAITPDGTRAYVTNNGSNSVSVIDTATNTVVATVHAYAIGVAITPDGTRAYVTQLNLNNLAVIDTATNTVVANIKDNGCPAAIAITPASHVLTFASGPSTRVHKVDTAFSGLAENVCLNASFPANCPAGATVYHHHGGGWSADLSSIPTATWIYARGITGASSPAELTQYSFHNTFTIPAAPTRGTLFVAADDAAQIIVNGIIVGEIGSITDVNKASDAQNRIHRFDITQFLVKGTNVVKIRQGNGPATFGKCQVPSNYACNPSGVVFGGSAIW